jgi:pSer/pThr/pTyr-binding forkhead associated (FHA) protein
MMGIDLMEACLKILFGPASGQTMPVPAGETVIGRDEGSLLGRQSEFVSRRHCQLNLDDDSLKICDLGSKNGTFVNGHRIGADATALLHGDFVSVGDLLLQVVLSPAAIEKRSELPDAAPVISSAALQTTEVFSADTIQAAAPKIVPGTSPTSPEDCLRS